MRAWLIVLSVDGSSAKPFFRGEGGKENSVQVLEQKLINAFNLIFEVKVWIDCLSTTGFSVSLETYYSMIQVRTAVIFIKHET